MSSSTRAHRATSVDFRSGKMVVELEDGREITVPLGWFPRLEEASPEERENWRLIGKGEGIHWDDVDEDVSVYSLLNPEDTIPSRHPREHEPDAS